MSFVSNLLSSSQAAGHRLANSILLGTARIPFSRFLMYPLRAQQTPPEVRIWEATLQSEGLRQCRRERYFNVYGLLGRVLPGLEGQQAFFDGGEPLGGGGVGGFQVDHAGEVAAGEGFDAA